MKKVWNVTNVSRVLDIIVKYQYHFVRSSISLITNQDSYFAQNIYNVMKKVWNVTNVSRVLDIIVKYQYHFVRSSISLITNQDFWSFFTTMTAHTMGRGLGKRMFKFPEKSVL